MSSCGHQTDGHRFRAPRDTADIEYGSKRSRAETVGHQAAFRHGYPCRMFTAQSAGCGACPPGFFIVERRQQLCGLRCDRHQELTQFLDFRNPRHRFYAHTTLSHACFMPFDLLRQPPQTRPPTNEGIPLRQKSCSIGMSEARSWCFPLPARTSMMTQPVPPWEWRKWSTRGKE